MADGTLDIRVWDESGLGPTLPFEIRDAQRKLVRSGFGSERLWLVEGLYSVDVLLGNGSKESQLVQVVANGDATLTFGVATPEPPTAHLEPGPDADRTEVVLIGGRAFAPRRPTSKGRSGPAPVLERIDVIDDLGIVELESTVGCHAHLEANGRWVFVATGTLDATPTATFCAEGLQMMASLPLNPRDRFGYNACTVEAFRTPSGPKLQTRFAPERHVATLVEGILRSGEVVRGARLLDQASRLLADKYEDPAAATLGGLTLHRLGHLTERADWVENLARDFPWLPDGQVLLAALLLEHADRDELNRGLQLLLAASQRRPMYTDGISLMMELLRRWPDEGSEPSRRARLQGLAGTTKDLDWNAVSLTVYQPVT